MNLLQVKDLVKTYGKGDTVIKALNGVTFNVEKGEFVAIIGRSGSGKSTLMHTIGGIDRPTSGNVFVNGNDICKLNESKGAIFRRRNIGIVYQFYNLVPTLTVEENITLPYLLDKRKPDDDRLKMILEAINLSDRMKHLPSELSGGQQQRVAIGRALINDPSLILADEPTGNLDSKSSCEIINLLRAANKDYNQTFLIITHDENIARQADRIITIDDGQILKDEVI